MWKYPREKGSPGAPLSTWAVAGTLAMARPDRVEAYGLTTGDPLWTWQPPEGDLLAHASADAPDGVGVVLHHDHADGDENGGAEHIRLTGLDVGSGRVLWSREQRADALGSVDGHAREVALGGGLIVTARPGDGDRDRDGPPALRTINARTGALQWERPVPERWGHVSVVRAHPVVVSTEGPGEGAPRRLVVVGGETEREIELPRWAREFGGDVAVVGDTLAVECLGTPTPDGEEDTGSTLNAYSVTTGVLRWTWSSTYGATLSPLAHRGHLVVLNGYGDRATVLDPADGRVVAERTLPGYSYRARPAAAGDCLAVVCTAERPTHRLRVFRWK
ncbi:PQQ-binding-like beta-propeller repeat protein [Streptomyces phaeochromogenes]|uniref:outer membrane protein assembly factor BamB family protein n=1 Tax=Streptomyces phaeochromogenes TaxID=1923 RepID=UPI002DDA4DB3|nr:PQQ-binding-like beta-propeller repeat protein [Streptomyces phaeochromogenes]WRZ36279.1 PQQ-binding-like beta-propeller repeat protein [Streptomyces phaeochromogenes]